MSLILPTSERFAPVLKLQDVEGHIPYFRRWEFPMNALPVPEFDERHKAAVWIAGRTSKFGEKPVLATVVPLEARHVNRIGLNWFVGVAKDADLRSFIEDETGLAHRALDAAENGPHSIYGGLDVLEIFLPPGHLSE